MSEAARLHCPHSETCSVCSWIHFTSEEQKLKKLQALKNALTQKQISFPENIEFHSQGLSQIRDRVDMTYQDGRYGFFKRDSRELFDLQECPLMSENLFTFFKEIQKIHIPIKKGSLRLRVSPSGERGLWLDFANEDIRDLLQERSTFEKFLSLGFVEIGQRRKKLSLEMKLRDPEFHLWTRTWSEGKAIDLFSLVGSFSQSGDRANRILVQQMEKLFQKTQSSKWVEFGAGSGNLTFPLAGKNRTVTALEFEGLALEGLEKSLKAHPEFQNRIELIKGDYQRKSQHRFSREQGVLVNPPRSGLQKFLDPLESLRAAQRPRDFVYMSCFLESFVEDGCRLQKMEYRIQDLLIVDQFPNSPHFEILSRWENS